MGGAMAALHPDDAAGGHSGPARPEGAASLPPPGGQRRLRQTLPQTLRVCCFQCALPHYPLRLSRRGGARW
eukprot:15463229-Alexandrium_andersonii.AAC.1